MESRFHLRSALAGGIVAALLVSAIPAVASTIVAVMAGEINDVDVRTGLRGNVDTANLTLDNTNPDGSGLSISVEKGNAPLEVNSPKRVKKLNADKVDGRHAHSLIRVASAARNNVAEPSSVNRQPVLTTSITAPTGGFLVLTGGVDALSSSTGSTYTCSVPVDGVTVIGSRRNARFGPAASDNREEDCSTQGVVSIGAGTYDVTLDIKGWLDGTISGGSVWAIYVPYDGTGQLGGT